jgi:peroxiredoxin
MQDLGTKAPIFRLPGTDGKIYSFNDIAGPKGTLVMFICNHCPYVVHIRKTLAATTEKFSPLGIGMVAISSNDAEAYPDDGPVKMKAEKLSAGYLFPYLYDESQDVAKAYQAACTPDFFLYDSQQMLVYRGQMDGSRPGNGIANDGADLVAAMEALIHGREISAKQVPSMGCNIKWKRQN